MGPLPDVRFTLGSSRTADIPYRQLCANALNRCAIARCAGSPTASTVAGVKIVDSARVALS